MRKRKKKKLMPKKPLTTREKWTLRIVSTISFIFIFIGMFSCIEIGEMDNNLSGVTFFFLFFTIGLIVCFFLNSLIEKKLPEYLIKSKVYKTVEGSFFMIAFILPAIANYYNRTYPISKINYETYKVIEKAKGSHRSNNGYTYWLFVDINNDKERLETDEQTWDNVNEYGNVKLGIATGGLGFKYVSEIRAN